jgi:hypothetical protein
MGRPKKLKVPLRASVHPQVRVRIIEQANDRNQTITDAVEELLKEALERREKGEEG